jgi:flagellar biosynthesis/type III secretory pathway M-ring protein FliF/YscJ
MKVIVLLVTIVAVWIYYQVAKAKRRKREEEIRTDADEKRKNAHDDFVDRRTDDRDSRTQLLDRLRKRSDRQHNR